MSFRPSSGRSGGMSGVDEEWDVVGRHVLEVKVARDRQARQTRDRLLVLNILDRNTFDRTFGANLLLTYRVNAGTVFFLGYDDRYRHSDMTSSTSIRDYQRTNRAIFDRRHLL